MMETAKEIQAGVTNQMDRIELMEMKVPCMTEMSKI